MSKIHCVGAYQVRASVPPLAETQGFNGHPPLGANATLRKVRLSARKVYMFQWAPTLGGECYCKGCDSPICPIRKFQWAPTLGGECYRLIQAQAKPFS